MSEITDENFNIAVFLLSRWPEADGKRFVAVSFNVETKEKRYPRTNLLDFLDEDFILDLLDSPTEYAFNGAKSYDPEDVED